MPEAAAKLVLCYATPPPRRAGEFTRACMYAAGLLFRIAVMLTVMVSLTALALLTAGWLATQVPALSP